MTRTVLAVMLVGLVVVFGWAGSAAAPASMPSAAELAARDEALARAKIFTSQTVPANDPAAGGIDRHLTTCTFIPDKLTGTTPKFECRLEGGGKIKVKYGWTREIPSDLAATQLLHLLGLGAKSVWAVDTVRCYGCVAAPFHVRMLAEILHLREAFDKHLNYNHAIDFVHVAVERNLEGAAIVAGSQKGWGFYELSKIDVGRGGATLAEVDALRLVAMLLNHWDNKGDNQRLLCEGQKHTTCEHPLVMIQDAGASFGPYKVNLQRWSSTPVWSDAATCTVSMKNLPFHGGTFPDTRISEDGRRLLARRLAQLTDEQIKAIFSDAGFREADKWAAALKDRIRQISDRASCPTE